MQTKSYTTIDRTGWQSGPWDDEPDKVEWTDEATGLPCLAARNPVFGNWCGYVGIASGHPYHEVAHYEVKRLLSSDIDITFGDYCTDDESGESGLCYFPDHDGDPDVYWLGFHCGYFLDIMPCSPFAHVFPDSQPLAATYKTLAYVQDQCRQLAAQLAAHNKG